MAEIKMEVPKEIITAHVAAAVMEALGRDPVALVKAIVDEAMQQKKNSYDRETVFLGGVKELIRHEATEIFKQWLETKRDTLRQAILSRLKGDEGQFVNDVADHLIAGLTKNLYVSVTLPTEEK